ncbi:glycoside hydrolase family 53 protein [Paenibacillus endoradicis]|uniref:glycoside hydrolase family 53 protein n=1 Tax=Paenibacillus endoradicis TaxID=2972487 RepID=UPI0021592633|nr:arabinogalactan endo-1,4-beta-galactosidase [Paenibacillus endoradicis]MCR8657868.1 arabinogalactan endo-1,4-beta-galactosidase [Paenibacillus endoradicis]
MELSFIKGADVSFVDEIETEGGAFYEDGVKKDVLDILKDSGVNSARLRLWNNPEFDYCNPAKTIKMGKRIKERGLHFLLDFHYSDYWADPVKQHMPKAWEKLSFVELEAVVKAFTRNMVEQLMVAGATPDMIQIGNEITNGMIWGEGRVDGEYDTPEQWDKLARLIIAGIEGVNEASPNKHIPIMIHIDRGADNAGSRYFYDKIAQYPISYDIIGLSYYSWWHGTLEQLTHNMDELAARYEKDIVVVEVAYPWTMTPPDDQQLIFNRKDWIYEGFPVNVEGQSKWLTHLMRLIKEVEDNRGLGLYYWEPCWIPSKLTWSVGHENNWSNLTLFDYKGNKLNSLDAFKME